MKFNLFSKIFLSLFIPLLIFFLLGEVILRFYVSRHQIYDIEMARYATLLKVSLDNPNIGHFHKQNKELRLMGVPVKTNSYGFRDKEYRLAKTDKYRIIFLGDSITFGWGVKEEDTFKSLIERKINRLIPVEIINFGVGNFNTQQELNLFLFKGLQFNPDKVVVFYTINDAEITPKRSALWFLGYSDLAVFYWSRINNLFSNVSPNRDFKEYYAKLYRSDAQGWRITQKSFLDLKELCKNKHIDLQVVLLPDLHQLKDYPFLQEQAMVVRFLRNNGINCIDITPVFIRFADKPSRLWVASDDPHPNSFAHSIIADATLKFILEGINAPGFTQ